MSHIVTVVTRIHDPAAVAAACARLNLAAPVQGTVQLYSGEASGLIVQLPGWEYAVAIDTLTGTIRYDNYGGAWGDPAQLDRFQQAYAVEKARIAARKRGHSVVEQALPDGSIKLTIHVGGAA